MVNTTIVSRHNKGNYANNDLFGDYLYTLVNKHIRKMAGKFYSVLDDDDIDDMVQDAWLLIREGREKYDATRNFEGWVFRICQNFVRKTTPKFTQRRDTFSSYDDHGQEDSGYSSDLADITFAADNDIIEREEEAKFHTALKHMSDSEREIVLMAKEGYSNSDMAEALGITDGNLRIKKHRAYKVLDKFRIRHE